MDKISLGPVLVSGRTAEIHAWEEGSVLKRFQEWVDLFHAVYIRRYFQLQPGDEREYRGWLPIVAAARLSEGIHELEGWLVAQARKAL